MNAIYKFHSTAPDGINVNRWEVNLNEGGWQTLNPEADFPVPTGQHNVLQVRVVANTNPPQTSDVTTVEFDSPIPGPVSSVEFVRYE